MLTVDSGNLFTERETGSKTQQALTKATLISRTYTRMGVAALNVSTADLTLGLTFFRNEASQGLPLISANIIDPVRSTPIFAPSLIKKVGNIRIAFFGLTSTEKNRKVNHPRENNYLVEDPVKAARHTFRKLHKRADIIILLSDLDVKQERKVIRAVPGIHFVLGGRESRYIHIPLWEGRTPVLDSHKKGMYAGVLRLSFMKASSSFTHRDAGNASDSVTDTKGGNTFSWALVPLHTSLPEDGEVSSWIRSRGIEKD